MSSIKIKGSGETISELLRINDYILPLPCSGSEKCGGCVVLASGKLDLPSKREKSILGQKAIKTVSGFTPRLACMCRVLGNAKIIIENDSKAISSPIANNVPNYDGTDRFALGFAIDVGTATIRLELHNLTKKVLLSSQMGTNPQTVFGDDLSSRITYAKENGINELHNILLNKLIEMIETALLEVKVFAEDVRRVVVTGNTAIMHFFRGVCPVSAPSLFGEKFAALELFPEFTHAHIYMPRCISANIGSDITAGLYSTDFFGKSGTYMYVDVGTNCEIVLIKGKKTICSAFTAGPVFEGFKITKGMSVRAGAIQRVRHTGYGVMCDTLFDAPPVGICGSGLISAANLLKKMGELDESGYLETDPYELGTSGIHIYGRDIRELQMAKSAVAAGICMVLEKSGIHANSLDKFILAGGFGNDFDPAEAAAIGLIPEALKDKTVYVGNAALHGAVICMYSQSTHQKVSQIANVADDVQLSEDPGFDRLKVERMIFKPY